MTISVTPYIDLARDLLRDYQPRVIDAPGARRAAVMTLLFHDLGADRVLLTKRTDTVEHHKGQISFPGGGVDADDVDLSATALRETWEEVGVDPDHVEIIGQLDEIVTISNFLVTPYVGVLHRTPYVWVPSDIEVAEVLEPPIAVLLEEATLVLEERFVDGAAHVAPAYHWNGHRIWGATARMLHEFLDLLRGAPDRLAAIEQTVRL